MCNHRNRIVWAFLYPLYIVSPAALVCQLGLIFFLFEYLLAVNLSSYLREERQML